MCLELTVMHNTEMFRRCMQERLVGRQRQPAVAGGDKGQAGFASFAVRHAPVAVV